MNDVRSGKSLSMWLFIAVCIAVSNISTVYGQSSLNRYRQGDKLHAGDGVRILVWQDITIDRRGQLDNLDLAGDYLIDGSGNILVPVLGEIKAAGYSPVTLGQVMQEKLAIKTIRIVCLPLIRVTVLGAVNRPGSYLIQPKDSLWELVNQAGGPANNVDMKKIKVERGGRVVIDNLLEGFEKAHSLDDIGVRSGDQLILPSASKITAGDILRYASFGMSVAVLYLQITRDQN